MKYPTAELQGAPRVGRIATGTPSGVGLGFKPPRFFQPGDVMRLGIGGIGVLENPLAAI